MKHTLRRLHLISARQSMGLSALNLAEESGILTEHQVYNIERGRTLPDRDVAAILAGILRMPLAEAFPEYAMNESGVAK